MPDKEQQETTENTGSSEFDRGSLFGTNQLLVVSNRQPYQHERSENDDISVNRPVGGLTASLDPLMQENGGTWIAWGDGEADKDVVDDADCVGVPPEDENYRLKRVWLSDEQVKGYYYGFSNQVLWPLCHSALSAVHAERSYWEAYRQTNEQFATKIVEAAEDSSVIWLQDYHLALAPWLVRRELGGAPTIMQFWHVPWPTWDVFRACPRKDELLRGLLGNDVLGFHVERYVNNFLECVEASLDDATVDRRSGVVSYRGGITRTEAIPMGVPFAEIRRKASSHSETDFEGFRRSHGIDQDTRIAVGVDRLDYSKGIPERLRALEQLWEQSPEWQGDLTYVQNGTESRSQIAAYEALQTEVDEEIERINNRFETDEWQPIVRVSEYLSEEELYGLYRHSDLGIVSPIRDGFNLVAAEYAAAQVDADGVLLLSEQTGAHDLLGEHVVSVSPFDVERFADSLQEALTMPFAERRLRMDHIRQTVADNNLQTWLEKHASVAQTVNNSKPLVKNERT